MLCLPSRFCGLGPVTVDVVRRLRSPGRSTKKVTESIHVDPLGIPPSSPPRSRSTGPAGRSTGCLDVHSAWGCVLGDSTPHRGSSRHRTKRRETSTKTVVGRTAPARDVPKSGGWNRGSRWRMENGVLFWRWIGLCFCSQ